MGAKESVEAAAKMNADGWGHVEVNNFKPVVYMLKKCDKSFANKLKIIEER